MDQEKFIHALGDITHKMYELEKSKKALVVEHGISLLKEKMKKLGKSALELRTIAFDLFSPLFERYLIVDSLENMGLEAPAIKKVKLDDNDNLIVVATSYSEGLYTDGSREYKYYDDDEEMVADEEFAREVLTEIIISLLTDDELYDYKGDEDDEDDDDEDYEDYEDDDDEDYDDE